MSKADRKKENRRLIQMQNASGGNKKKGRAMHAESKNNAGKRALWRGGA